MRPISLALVACLSALLVQACGSDDGISRSASSADCPPAPVYVEGSAATYRIERADGTTEDVTATVSAYSSSDQAVTFTLEGDGGAYSVTDDLGCYDTGNAPPRAASDIGNDSMARLLLSPSETRIEPLPTSMSASGDEGVAPPDIDETGPCRTLDGSEEIERFASRPTRRCVSETPSNGGTATLTIESVYDGEVIDEATGEIRRLPVPVTGLIFRELVGASGAVDRVRLIDWNGQ